MSETMYVYEWKPDYTHKCDVCGHSPVVTGVDEDGNVLVATDMCGACTWGEVKCLDPANW